MSNEKENICENVLEQKTISQILGCNYFIPGYQRGYKWTKQQVTDLLNDINSFDPQKYIVTNPETGEDEEESTWYCLQPLVVKKLSEDEIKKFELSSFEKNPCYEIIDGQQRLTTIYLIIKFLNIHTELSQRSIFGGNAGIISLPNLSYETRRQEGINASEFLKGFTLKNGIIQNSYTDDMDVCTDFHYMKDSFEEILNWFKEQKENFSLDNFRNKLLYNTKFIWYESKNEDPIKVFQRLNVGKIPLTSAELIKALFLNQANYRKSFDYSRYVYIQQVQIASEWDKMECKLQDATFWAFLNDLDYDKPTRIDFIFDLIRTQDILEVRKHFIEKLQEKLEKISEKEKEKFINQEYTKLIGEDDYSTFRYFYEYFKIIRNSEKKVLDCWKKIKNIFMVFEEWYDDIELYHYVGYLLYFRDRTKTINTMYSKWKEFSFKQGGLTLFKNYLKDEIKGLLKNDNCNNLNQIYDLKGNPKKAKVKSLLLLHNIQTIINQNKNFKEKAEYQNGVIYKFPFSLFQKEKWHIEHISPDSPNDLEEEDSQREYLMSVYNSNISSENKKMIKNYLLEKYEVPEERNREFQKVLTKLQIERNSNSEILVTKEERDRVWNFVLLDEHTNTSYGNSIYSAKRRVLIGKDLGKKFVYNSETFELEEKLLKEDEKDKFISFVPLCTKNVFMKFYSPVPNDLTEWTKDDASYYLKDIETTLKEFI